MQSNAFTSVLTSLASLSASACFGHYMSLRLPVSMPVSHTTCTHWVGNHVILIERRKGSGTCVEVDQSQVDVRAWLGEYVGTLLIPHENCYTGSMTSSFALLSMNHHALFSTYQQFQPQSCWSSQGQGRPIPWEAQCRKSAFGI